jgi:hypothetical protein
MEPLFASEVPLGRLHGYVPQKKLDLLQLTSRLMTQAGTGATEVVGRQSWNLTDLCFLLNHAPDDLRAEAATPDSASLVDTRHICSRLGQS